MATFQAQVTALTGITISSSGTNPTEAQLTQYLVDGVMDVTNRWLLVRPQDVEDFQRESSTISSNGGFETKGAQIISVIRESGSDGSSDGSTSWRDCRKIPASMQSRAVDTDSLHFASKYNPVYTIIDYNKVHVYPTPDGTDDGFKVFYVNNDPTPQTGGDDITYAMSTIKYFPDNKVYLVAIYAGIKSLQTALGNTGISTFSLSAAAPGTPNDPTISYSAASLTSDIAAAQDAISVAQDAITVGPTDASGTTDVQAPTDAAGIDVSAGPTDAAGITDTDAPSDASGDASSAYTKPAVAGDGDELTDVDDLDTDNTIDVHADQIEIDQWWSTLGHLIEDEEDSELANSQIQKIQAYIQAFQAEVQSASAAMQATIQDAQLATQASIANASNDVSTNNASIASRTQASVANAANDASVKNASISSQTQASIANASNDVSTNNASMATLVQASIANASNDVNASISKMQNSTQAATAKMVQSTSAAIQKMSLATNVSIQNAAKTLEASIQDYSQEIALFQGEIAKFQASVAGEIQAYQQEIAEKGTEYQWMTARLKDLKEEYDRAFLLAAPKQQQQARA